MGTSEATAGAVKTAQTPKPGQVPDPLGLGALVTERKREYPVGTRRLTGAGYVSVKVYAAEGGGALWEAEHRLVLERHLGRRLWDDEEARHRAGVERWDNRLESLELWRGGRPVKLALPRKPAKKRTNWKRRHLQLLAALEQADVDAWLQRLDSDVAAELETLLTPP